MRGLVGALALGLTVRVVLLAYTADLGPKIIDEEQFVQLAGNVLHGNGLAWEPGQPTSIRPPLYPAFLAGIWAVFGEGNFQAVRVVQCVIALLTAGLVYLLGRRTFGPAAGNVAAAVTWLYPSLVFMNLTLLTETLFTFLLVGFVLLSVLLIERPSVQAAAACGAVLGLGALTRSVLWPLPLLFCPLLVVLLGGSLRRRLLVAGVVLLGYGVVVAPWAVRNTRLQGVVTIVDTMGGMNLRMGNYEHTPENRMWDAVSLTGEKSWVHALTQETGGNGDSITEGQKEKWAQRKAIEYMVANPGTTLRRAVIKLGDLWGLERSLLAGVQQGLYSPPTWFVMLAAGLITLSTVAVLVAGLAGLWLVRPAWRMHVLLLVPILTITAVHTIVFGHSRYHLPLVPIVALYAAGLGERWTSVEWRAKRLAVIGAAVTVVMLLASWVRQVALIDQGRIRDFLGLS
jgi:4-amino-4-deoxy-L-arabinose transferase-like glycosyltransferase